MPPRLLVPIALTIAWIPAMTLAQSEELPRQTQARTLADQVRDEVAGLSPFLIDKVDWAGVVRTLAEAGQSPSRSLARAAVLCQVYYLVGWPTDQQLELLGQFLGDAGPAVRRLCIDLLARDEAIQAGSLRLLVKASESDADPAIRVQAGHELLRRDDPAGWKPLLAALVSDDPRLRGSASVPPGPQRDAKAALMQLTLERWRFGDNAARLPEPLRLTPQTLKLATETFVMRDNLIRRTVVEAIGLDRNPANLDLLLERLAMEDAWTVHRSLYVGLGYLGQSRAIPALADGLSEPKLDRTGRTAPATGLAVLGDPAALKILVEATTQPDRLHVAAAALSRAFDPDFVADEASVFLVPEANGRLAKAWVPAAATETAPMFTDGRGGRNSASGLSAADVHAAWRGFLIDVGPSLRWDRRRCCFAVAPRADTR